VNKIVNGGNLNNSKYAKTIMAWWRALVVPATWEADVKGSLEPEFEGSLSSIEKTCLLKKESNNFE
jgi:hypothetical protein